jgi:hypothetical protein
LHTGTDYFGPFQIRLTLRRGGKTTKGFAVLFICLSTEAIHLELVNDLTTESFLSALRRFVSRRGRCAHIYADNATYFTKANKDLKELRELFRTEQHQKTVQTELTNQGVQWHFIPPRSPHFGGLWESGVRLAKYHLKRIVGKATLSYEELLTVLTHVEACLNSRPVIPMSNDPSDLTALTPGHFLIEEALTTYPEPSLQLIQQNRLSHWQYVQQHSQHFWSRWSREYLSELQRRSKWNTVDRNIELNTLVLMREDNISPMQWRLARVSKLHPGEDGIFRAVTVKTAKGELRRAVKQLCLLLV